MHKPLFIVLVLAISALLFWGTGMSLIFFAENRKARRYLKAGMLASLVFATMIVLMGQSGQRNTSSYFWVNPQAFEPSTQGNINVVNNLGWVNNGTTDNAGNVAGLMTALDTSTTASSGIPVLFAPSTASTTWYYMSSAFHLSRVAAYYCSGQGVQAGGLRRAQTNFVFADGVDGFVFDSNLTSSDGGTSLYGSLTGCGIYSFSYRTGSIASSTSITGATTPTYGSKQGGPWAANDGIIAIVYRAGALADTSGTYLASVSGSTGNQTLTLAGSYTLTGSGAVTLWRLPFATNGSTVTTTSGSNTVTTTGGNYLWQAGDACWSDAFPFPDCTVFSVSGTLGAQTLVIKDRTNVNVSNATITHAAGSGQMYKINAGVLERNSATINSVYTKGFPIGFQAICSSGMTPALNCTEMGMVADFHELSIFGRWTAGDNTGGSYYLGNIFSNNYLTDEYNEGTIGSFIAGDSFNSGGNASIMPMQGNCANNNTSGYYGVYVEGGSSFTFCTGSIGTSVSTMDQPTGGNPTDIPVRKGNNYQGMIKMQNTSVQGYLGDNSVATAAMGVAQSGGTLIHRLTYGNCIGGTWAWVYLNGTCAWSYAWTDSGYTGTHSSLNELFIALHGIELGASSGTTTRHLEQFTAAPTSGNWDTGDIVFDRNATISGKSTLFAWMNTAGGAPGTFTPIYAESAPSALTTLTTTAATSDNVTVTGLTTNSFCTLTPTNSSGATLLTSAYLGYATNTLTVNHTATAGGTYQIWCKLY